MPLRILVIDDSAYNRQIISETLSGHPDIEVVGKADDGEQGLKMAAALRPDLITLDLEMPRMDGFTFLRLLMSQMPTPVIVVSSHSRKQQVFQALELGALDFIAKPARFFSPEADRLSQEIVAKVLAVKSLQVIPFSQMSARAVGASPERHRLEAEETPGQIAVPLKRLVVLGASTGGPPALQTIFKAVGAAEGVAYLVAQHMPEKFTKAFADRLNRVSTLNICEAEDGVPVLPGSVYVSPGGSHMEVAPGAGREYVVRLRPRVQVDRYVPSIDRILASAAQLKELEMLAIVLTGMGADGSQGVRQVRACGGHSIAESDDSAIVFGMPKEAIQTGCIDDILPLEGIIESVHAFARAGISALAKNRT